jgi:micrococcal nuclease
MRWTGIAYGVAAILLAGQALAAPLPPCANVIELAGVRVDLVGAGGVLALHDGHKLQLESVLLPAGPADHAPLLFRDQALTALDNLVAGHEIVAAARSPLKDRYGRLEAQIFLPNNADSSWLQIAIIERGLGRVFITPDRPECAGALFAAERFAREHRAGIWAAPAYAVRTPDALSGRDRGTFQIVQGKVVHAAVKGGRGYLDFGADWKTDFTASIAPDCMKMFRELGIDPRTYEGHNIRVRGWIDEYHGPEIDVAAPQDIELAE